MRNAAFDLEFGMRNAELPHPALRAVLPDGEGFGFAGANPILMRRFQVIWGQVGVFKG